MLAGYVLAPDDYINLAHLCSKYLDVYAWKHLSGSDMLTYNGLDAAYTWKLWDAEETELLENKQLQFFARHVMPLLPHAVMALHSRGIKLDLKRRRELKHQWDAEYCNWEVELRGHFEALSLQYGQELLAPVGKKGALSSKQMQVLLYDVFKLPEQKHSGTRKTTTDKHALNKLEPMDKTGTITLLLKRSRLKENEHHIQVQPDNDCRVRARYVLGGDEKHRELTEKGSSRSRDKAPGTGRLASREPNHQNVPLSAKIVYVPSLPTWWLVEADSSQIEARLTAYFTKDRMLQEAIDSGDIYLYTLKRLDDATGLYKLRGELDKDDPKISVLRHEAKRAFLGWSYRMGAKKLELHTGIPFKRAKTILDGLNSTFTGVVRKWSEYEAAARSQGYLENPFGRRRYFYKVDVPQVCNFFSQSTAADILFRGHRDLNCDPWTGKIDGVEGYFLATVHDSNLAEGPEWDPVASALRNVMEAPIPELDGLSIPVEIKIGKSWGEMKKI
jgi:DNA polymerase I-like protein with 3'-5' exonuclease and polymerase domains